MARLPTLGLDRLVIPMSRCPLGQASMMVPDIDLVRQQRQAPPVLKPATRNIALVLLALGGLSGACAQGSDQSSPLGDTAKPEQVAVQAESPLRLELVPATVAACGSTLIAVGSRLDDALQFGLLEIKEESEDHPTAIVDSGRRYAAAVFAEGCAGIVAVWQDGRDLGFDTLGLDGSIERTIRVGQFTLVGSVAVDASSLYLGVRYQAETRASLVAISLENGAVQRLTELQEYSDRDPVVLDGSVLFLRHHIVQGQAITSTVAKYTNDRVAELWDSGPDALFEGSMTVLDDQIALYSRETGARMLRLFKMSNPAEPTIVRGAERYRNPRAWAGRPGQLLVIDAGVSYATIRAVALTLQAT